MNPFTDEYVKPVEYVVCEGDQSVLVCVSYVYQATLFGRTLSRVSVEGDIPIDLKYQVGLFALAGDTDSILSTIQEQLCRHKENTCFVSTSDRVH